MNKLIAMPFALFLATQAFAQGVPQQAGPWTPGHVPQYGNNTNKQSSIKDGGGAGGGGTGVNPSELGITVRSPTNTYPATNVGNGPNNTNFCIYDAPITNATGYHYLCLGVNTGGGGLLTYGYGGGASAQPLYASVNGSPSLPIVPYGYTIATLPTCNTSFQGARVFVTNGQTSPSYLGAVSTTGSTVAPIFCNGTAWVYG